jgi:hypothetical protein|tara:strand:+ start:50 stop:400 length:351 start_codon:yes stop_codon:yes gene_type:complete
MANTKVKWDSASERWEKAPLEQDSLGTSAIWTWDDVTLLEELKGQNESGENILWNIDKLEPEKKKRFIRLVCKVRGIETFSGQKTIRDDIEITVEDVELVYKKVLGIDLAVENIKI